ncbi:MAG: FhaA domain-containing protein [Acidobacteriota bacterium]
MGARFMVSNAEQILTEMERLLANALRTSLHLNYNDLQPARIVQQIADDLAKNSFIWLGNTTYVPNRVIIFLPEQNNEKLEELHVLFNSPAFISLLDRYISERGFELFDTLRFEIEAIDGEHIQDESLKISFRWITLEEYESAT